MSAGIDHSRRAHARFGASSAHRWFACPGSVRACEGVPDVPSEAALEGTRAHEWLEAVLTNSDRQHRDFQDAPEDMWAAVDLAANYVQDILESFPDAVMLVEQRFEIPVASAPGEVFGTCDVCIFVPSLRLLYVIDYKHGAGTYVEVKGNKQMRFYGLGALSSQADVNDVGEPCLPNIDTVALVVMQPRLTWAEPVREEWLPVEDLLAFGPVIGEAIARCKAPDAPLVPGEDQCRFCAVRTTCPAREAHALATIGDSFGDVRQVTAETVPKPNALSVERLAAIAAAAPAIRSWLAACEDEERERMLAGEEVPGRKLVEAQARREWVDNGHEAAKKLGEIASSAPDVFMARKLKTLTEVEALLKKGVDRQEARRRLDAMAFLTTKKSTGALKVVDETDPRPAVNRADKAFGSVAQIEHVQLTENRE